MRIERRPTPNFVTGREGHQPVAIVLHTTDGTLEQACSWFAKARSGVSAHYLVGLDGRIVRFVEEEDTARHAGRVVRRTAAFLDDLPPRTNPNLVTIGIEFEDGGDPAAAVRPDEQYAAGAQLVAEVAGRWGIPIDRRHVIGHRKVHAGKSCPGNLDVERLIAEARAPDERPEVVCLLPVRNGERDLPGYLEAAPAWCDAIVALDDGSTDRTRELLEASPLVRVLLENPPRPTAAGWDDGANRRRLLDVAGQLAPEWVISLDVDERIPPADAAALREFLVTDALPGVAYGFPHHRMWGEDRYDAEALWVYRLFAWQTGQQFPDERLHFTPVPTAIPRRAWLRTSIRLQHLAAQDELRRAERRRKYEEADPEHEFRTDFGGLDRVPRRLARWSDERPNLPVLLPVEAQLGDARSIFDPHAGPAAPDDGAVAEEEAERPLLVVLLPARNCADELPAWFDSVRPLADAVVALDDGSTDETAAVLEAEPIVAELLGKPPRPDYAGWDDAANRNALLGVAASLHPRWIISLDADERLDPDDAASLRAYLESGEGIPGVAYAFRVYRMIEDEEHFDRAELWVNRMFAYEPGMRFPDDRLHFRPIPTQIAEHSRIGTTIRIKHLASLTEERRRERFEKYRQADAAGEWQGDYGHILDEPGEIHRWDPRPEGLPLLVHEAEHLLAERAKQAAERATAAWGERAEGGALSIEDLERAARTFGEGAPRPDLGTLEELDLDAPVLSAIVISHDDQDVIEEVVHSVAEQDCPEPFEVIVVTSGMDRTADIVRERFPDVTLVELDGHALPGAARNAGLAVARGDYVSFPGSHVRLPQGSLSTRVRAHERGWPMVTGSTLNGTRTPAGWASYFLDHSTVLPGRPSEELEGPPAHCSYDREFLLGVGGFPEDLRAGEDTVANIRLWRRGYRAYRAADVTLEHVSPCREPWALARHHFHRGRGLGRILVEGAVPGRPVLTREMLGRTLAGYLPTRLGSVRRDVDRWGGERLREVHERVRPLIALGASAALVGTWFELLRPAPGKLESLIGTPGWTIAIAGLDRRGVHLVGRTDVLLLARVEPLAGRVRLLSVPRDLEVNIPGIGLGRLNEAYFHGARRAGRGRPTPEPAGGDGGTALALIDGRPTAIPVARGGAAGDARRGMRRLERTLWGALGSRIAGTVLVDFEGFRHLVEALGGVEVEVPHPIHDEFVSEEDGEFFSAHFEPGRRRLGGEQALTFARTRKADGDAWRRQRHVDLVVAILRAAAEVRSPAQAAAVVRAALRSVRTDLGTLALVGVTQAFARARATPEGIEALHLSAPHVGSVRTEAGSWVHRGEPAEIRRFVRERLIAGLPVTDRERDDDVFARARRALEQETPDPATLR